MNFLIQQAVFTDFRPVFLLMLAILLVFFLLSWFRMGESRGLTNGLVWTVSIIHILIAGSLFFIESNMVETYALTADQLTLYLFIAIVVLAIANPLVYKLRNKSSSRYRYRRF